LLRGAGRGVLADVGTTRLGSAAVAPPTSGLPVDVTGNCLGFHASAG